MQQQPNPALMTTERSAGKDMLEGKPFRNKFIDIEHEF
jgi:hypothetical protein